MLAKFYEATYRFLSGSFHRQIPCEFFKETLVTASKISLRDAGIFLTLSCAIKIKNWYFWFWNLVGPLMRLFSTDFTRDLLVCVAGLYRNNGPVFRSLFFIFHFSFKNCYIGYTIVWTFLDFSFYQSDVKLKIRLVSYFIFLFFFLTLMSGIIFEIKCIEVNFFFFNFEFVISSGKKYRENFEKKWIFWTFEIYRLYIYISFFYEFFLSPRNFPRGFECHSIIRSHGKINFATLRIFNRVNK